MLIELESLSENGTTIDLKEGDSDIFPFGRTRPSTLPFIKRHTFNPTLPSTPEYITFRARSYCSLPVATPCDNGIDSPSKSRPSSCIISPTSNTHSPGIEHASDFEKISCYRWIAARWQKLIGKPLKRPEVVVKCDIVRRSKTVPSVLARRRRIAASRQFCTFINKCTKREWGEERHDDAIYAVMLKRIRRAPSAPDAISDGLQWETLKVRNIKGATLQHLVRKLCRFFVDQGDERNFLTIFFATYRSFATADEVLDAIMKESERLKSEPIEKGGPILKSIEQVLSTWVERYFDVDFYDPPDHLLLKKLKTVAEYYQQPSSPTSPRVLLSSENETSSQFLNYLSSKLQSAEVKSLQTEAVEAMNTPTKSCEPPNEDDDVCWDGTPLDLCAARNMMQHLPPRSIAEQLTVKDASLFLRVIPHHCLQAGRSSKDKPATVRATIDQFNKVVYCVLGTCLSQLLKSSQRAKIFCKWIEVAHVCREMKNFSSLRAIVSGLQTHAIHRLKRTWQYVPNSHFLLLEELEKLNMKDLVMTVGPSTPNRNKSSTLSRVRKDATFRHRDTSTMHGTVPYLGSFLTDLTYLHTANPDYIEKDFINFNKRRKEFELLAQLQLWQASCRSYQHRDSDVAFTEWFNSVTLITDEQAVQVSEQIEPPNNMLVSPTTPFKTPTISEKFASNSTAVSFDLNGSSATSFDLNKHSVDDSNNAGMKPNGQVMKCESTIDEERLINVQVIKRRPDEDTPSFELEQTKVMKLCSNDRSPGFMKKVMNLFELNEEDIQHFSLVQLLPFDKDIVIPNNGNVFYAMSSSAKEYKFALIEEGAEMPRDKRTQTLPTSGHRQKKLSRKSVSASSMPAKANVSPMKNIYRHFNRNGKSISSGSHSPAKQVQREDSFPADIENFNVPMALEPRASQDDSILYARSPPSDNSGYESDDSGWSQKMLKLVLREKHHRRNYSDSGHVTSNSQSSETSLQNKPYHMRSESASALPAKFIQSVNAWSAQSEASKGWSSSDDEDVPSREDQNHTWPRSGVFSPPSPNQKIKLARSKAFRKQPSPTPAPLYRQLTEETKVPSNVIPRFVYRSESRSKFYVGFNESGKHLESQSSTSSLLSMEPINESDSELMNSPPKRSFLRSKSDSCMLEFKGTEEPYFHEDSIKLPTITVQTPSPANSANSSFDETEQEGTPNSSRSSSICSETITTPL